MIKFLRTLNKMIEKLFIDKDKDFWNTTKLIKQLTNEPDTVLDKSFKDQLKK